MIYQVPMGTEYWAYPALEALRENSTKGRRYGTAVRALEYDDNDLITEPWMQGWFAEYFTFRLPDHKGVVIFDRAKVITLPY